MSETSGLALDSLSTLLTAAYTPFFMMIWIILNGSVISFPVEVMPAFFSYGYVTPFYNASQAARAIVFGTKNTIGDNMGILLMWVLLSCISLPLIQWYVRRRNTAQDPKQEKPYA
ncbi:hypothetical protein H0H81_008034 [Sphagnurus paluster]|uniref:DUF3533 domain-containing protein n=1 Tax=Sphagnurus paluster TaxID=117069 RepID=A0A9P7FQG2_9AGAR|nr:hypothetical protein H0H81_008034 [Sphagnurus paluster]